MPAKVLAGYCDSRHLWVATGESGRSPDLWLVEREKVEALKLFALSPEWRLNALSFALLPSGRRVAIGVAREDDKPGERSLLVRDLETGRDLREFQGIVVGLEPVAGSEAALSFGWLDEERLRFSESGFSAEKFAAFLKATGEELVPGENQSPAYFQWVDVDVRDGKRSAEKVYARIWGLGGSMPRHHAPEVERGPAAQGGGAGGLTLKGGSGYHEPDGAAASAANRAFFRQESGRLYFADGEEIVEILDKNRVVSAEVEVSPDGAWAAIQDPQRRVWLVDGKTRRKHLLLQGWCNNFCWLGPSS